VKNEFEVVEPRGLDLRRCSPPHFLTAALAVFKEDADVSTGNENILQRSLTSAVSRNGITHSCHVFFAAPLISLIGHPFQGRKSQVSACARAVRCGTSELAFLSRGKCMGMPEFFVLRREPRRSGMALECESLDRIFRIQTLEGCLL
jgi:hypothetical protein